MERLQECSLTTSLAIFCDKLSLFLLVTSCTDGSNLTSLSTVLSSPLLEEQLLQSPLLGEQLLQSPLLGEQLLQSPLLGEVITVPFVWGTVITVPFAWGTVITVFSYCVIFGGGVAAPFQYSIFPPVFHASPAAKSLTVETLQLFTVGPASLETSAFSFPSSFPSELHIPESSEPRLV